ncbi:MAG: glycosyltransferase family 4 protein [Hyphomonadaceae bacterium]|nr:glycosyltransferase family 4 protein [Hyphomonadaceae bacterium]
MMKQRYQYSVIQIGARHHYAVPKILEQEGMLAGFFTDGYAGSRPFTASVVGAFTKALPNDFTKRWLSRSGGNLPAKKIKSLELIGLKHAIRRRMSRDTNFQALAFCDHARQINEMAIKCGLFNSDAVFGYNGACLEAFKYAKSKGMLCVMDQTLAARSTMAEALRNEPLDWPGWQTTLQLPDHSDERSIREQKEWELADVILCPSEFVVNSVLRAGGPMHKCKLLPYGIDRRQFPSRDSVRRDPNGRLRLLFVGEVGLRKGAPYLLEAMRQISDPDIECRMVGGVALDPEILAQFSSHVSVLGAVPRSEILSQYAWADALVLPSLFEGSATVISEAISSGLPVICTPNAGAPPIDGILEVPVRSVSALVDALMNAKKNGLDMPSESAQRFVSTDRYANQLVHYLSEF